VLDKQVRENVSELLILSSKVCLRQGWNAFLAKKIWHSQVMHQHHSRPVGRHTASLISSLEFGINGSSQISNHTPCRLVR
jgi:hypothetical protein